jgi:branched-chain amino acid transport system substrate-binding protein
VGRFAERRNDEVILTGPSAAPHGLEFAGLQLAVSGCSFNNYGGKPMPNTRRIVAGLALISISRAVFCLPARAADPVKVGFSMALTGAVAQNGKQLIIALELWRDDVNARGGLLGRPVELVYYDDQSNPSNVPGIYTKLITVDKVDLLLGPYATNMAAAAVPVIMEHNLTTISILAIGVNQHFHYSRYFDMVPVGTEGTKAFSRGFFDLAAMQSQTRKPRQS